MIIWIQKQFFWLKTDPQGQMVLMGILFLCALLALLYLYRTFRWVAHNFAKVAIATVIVGGLGYILLHYGRDQEAMIILGGVVLTLLIAIGFGLTGYGRPS